jgi:hypothetical protein
MASKTVGRAGDVPPGLGPGTRRFDSDPTDHAPVTQR